MRERNLSGFESRIVIQVEKCHLSQKEGESGEEIKPKHDNLIKTRSTFSRELWS